jgi:hypothetical protein
VFGMNKAMAYNATCGHCGAALTHPTAPCWHCGAQPYYQALVRRGKSPALAALLAVVPGLGHLYLGDYRKGLGLLGAGGVLEFFGFDLDLTGIGAVMGVPMELGGVGLWLFSIVDAYQSARRMSRGVP